MLAFRCPCFSRFRFLAMFGKTPWHLLAAHQCQEAVFAKRCASAREMEDETTRQIVQKPVLGFRVSLWWYSLGYCQWRTENWRARNCACVLTPPSRSAGMPFRARAVNHRRHVTQVPVCHRLHGEWALLGANSTRWPARLPQIGLVD